MRTRVLLCAVCLALVCASAARAEGTWEWFLRTNGWGWSNGYHANNGCVKTGHGQRSYLPVTSSWKPTYAAPPVYQTPSPAVQPSAAEPLPPSRQMRPTGPMTTMPGDRDARRALRP